MLFDHDIGLWKLNYDNGASVQVMMNIKLRGGEG